MQSQLYRDISARNQVKRVLKQERRFAGEALPISQVMDADSLPYMSFQFELVGLLAFDPSRQQFVLLKRKSETSNISDDAALTAREQEVLQRVALGLTNVQIARLLSISENTVKVHLRHIFEKLNVQSRTEAAMYAI
jgi:DNA-binding NarL/FixJ family response regulator